MAGFMPREASAKSKNTAGTRGDPVIPTTRIGRIAEFDGIRALSVLFVLLVHISYGRISGGFLGVDVFFVLSGYLITMLLLKERERYGRINLPRFYVRRVLRIMPPLVIAVLLGVLLKRVVSSDESDDTERVWAVLLFYANFLPPETMGNLVHAWSLAIEEQFYLFWPALLLFAFQLHPIVPAILAILVIVVSVAVRVWMVIHIEHNDLVYTFTLSRLDSIMLGCLLALIEPRLSKATKAIGPLGAATIGWLSLALLISMLFLATRPFMQTEPFGFLAFAVLAATFVFISPRLPERSWLKLGLRQRAAQWLGQRSYGLYLYHYPIFLAFEVIRIPGDVTNFVFVAAAKIALSLAFAELAWRFVEQPVLNLKERYSSSPDIQERFVATSSQ